jgi:DNA-binding transcriptional regulator GbsR (MarR family)
MEFFVRAAQLLGQPRSLGEIYGLLYLSSEPLSMDEIVTRLKISTGSVSQGLKQLRAFRAVRTTYLPGARRDHFVAEQELRKVLNGFVQEEIRPHLESGRDRLSRMNQLVAEIGEEGGEAVQTELAAKIKRLSRLHSLSDRLLPLLMRFV